MVMSQPARPTPNRLPPEAERQPISGNQAAESHLKMRI